MERVNGIDAYARLSKEEKSHRHTDIKKAFKSNGIDSIALSSILIALASIFTNSIYYAIVEPSMVSSSLVFGMILMSYATYRCNYSISIRMYAAGIAVSMLSYTMDKGLGTMQSITLLSQEITFIGISLIVDIFKSMRTDYYNVVNQLDASNKYVKRDRERKQAREDYLNVLSRNKRLFIERRPAKVGLILDMVSLGIMATAFVAIYNSGALELQTGVINIRNPYKTIMILNSLIPVFVMISYVINSDMTLKLQVVHGIVYVIMVMITIQIGGFGVDIIVNGSSLLMISLLNYITYRKESVGLVDIEE